MRRSAIIMLVIALLLAPWSYAQQSLGDTNATAPQTGLEALPWVMGPATVPLFGNSTLKLPRGYRFLDAAGTAKLAVLTHTNVLAADAVTLAPRSLAWMAQMSSHGGGLVKDGDAALDKDALLGELQKQAKRDNRERKRKKLLPLTATAWAVPPAYDSATGRVQWAAVYESPGQQMARYTVAILGRRGFTQVELSIPAAEVDEVVPALTATLSGYEFNSGERYGDWQPGDPVAPYALADLVTGKTAILVPVTSLKGVLTLMLIAALLLLLLLLLFLVYWVVPRVVRKSIERVKERYTDIAEEINPGKKPSAGGENNAAGEPVKKDVKPVAASELQRSAVRTSEQTKTLVLAAVTKNPLVTLIVAGCVLLTYKHFLAMNVGIVVLLCLFLAIRGAALPAPEDTPERTRRKRLAHDCAWAIVPVVFGLCAVVIMETVFTIFSHDFPSVRAFENHLSYLVQSEEWTIWFTTAAIALCAGLAALVMLGASRRPTWLRSTLMAAIGLMVLASTYACVAPVPIRAEAAEEASALETRKKAEGEDTQKTALQALYLALQNLSPRDVRYYRTLFVELNDVEPYPEHAKLLQAMITDKLADTADSAGGGSLQKTEVPEVLEHPGHMEESFGVVRDNLSRQIGAESVEIRGLARTFVEQIVDAQARQLFSAEINLISPDQVKKTAIVQAQKILHVLTANGDSKIDVEAVRTELENVAKELKEADEKNERVDKLKDKVKDLVKDKLGGEEKKKDKKKT